MYRTRTYSAFGIFIWFHVCGFVTSIHTDILIYCSLYSTHCLLNLLKTFCAEHETLDKIRVNVDCMPTKIQQAETRSKNVAGTLFKYTSS